jgi:polysaccharide biosynthesis transport protein
MRFLQDYFSPLLKWWWLLILAPLIAAASAFLFARQLPPVYQAKTTLLIGRAIQDPNPSGNEFSMSYQLATEYANMAMREPVQNAAKTALGLTDLPEYKANARGIFLEIAVIHTDPRFAQAVANVLAQQLILLSPVNMQQTSGTDKQFVEQQLMELQDNIEKTRQDITNKQNSLSGMNSALELAKTQNDLKTLEDKMATMQSIYTELFASTREAAFNTLSVFDTASLPTVPIGPRKTLIVLLAAISGLAFAIGAAYLIEFLDDTIKNPDEISRLIDVPAIGYIGEMQGFKPTFVASHPRSPAADAFRGLRTNLEFMSVDRPMKKLAISSPEASDGKSTIAINLAIVIAQSEKKVILVDADLRSPSIHRYLGISDNPGLSDVFLDRVKVNEALVEWDGTPKFLIMPAGAIPPNSAELLGSHKMDQILDELAGMADIVILDGPPGFIVDAIVLSAKVDSVLLVVNIGETRRGSVKAVVEQFKRVDANLVGTVLNRISKSSAYYGSYYSSSYYSREPVTRPIQASNSKKKKFNLRFNPMIYFSRFMPGKIRPDAKQVDQLLKQAPLFDPPLHFEENQPNTDMVLTGVVQAKQEENMEVQPEEAASRKEDIKQIEAPASEKAEGMKVEVSASDQVNAMPPEGIVEPSVLEEAQEPKKSATTRTNKKRSTKAASRQEDEKQVEAPASEKAESMKVEVSASDQVNAMQPEGFVEPSVLEEAQEPKKSATTRTNKKRSTKAESRQEDEKQVEAPASEKADDMKVIVAASNQVDVMQPGVIEEPTAIVETPKSTRSASAKTSKKQPKTVAGKKAPEMQSEPPPSVTVAQNKSEVAATEKLDGKEPESIVLEVKDVQTQIAVTSQPKNGNKKPKKAANKKTSTNQPEAALISGETQPEEVIIEKMGKLQADSQPNDNTGKSHVEESTLSQDIEEPQKTVEPESRKTRRRKTGVT